MHHARKKNSRKMQKPKFNSSSSDDDDDGDIDDAAPIKWRSNIPPFPDESNNWRRAHSPVTNSLIENLNANVSKQQKLSAEVIEKEEIYNQAEVKANKIMFGCTNPGRCLSKDEIQRRKDIILQIVNERLKSKLSELMGEFGERLERNDRYDYGTSSADDIDRFRNQSPDDDDDDDDLIPEAPPPPTFNTSSSESSDEDLDLSMTKEFELYEKEIKEKTSSGVQPNSSNNMTTTIGSTSMTSSALSSFASYNSVPQQTSTNYQQSWQPTKTQQKWPTAAQSTDVWIPPVGPPQVMEPFLPPMESEQMTFMKPPTLFPTFPNTNPPAPVWINPSSAWTNPLPNTFESNYRSSVPQYPNPQSTPFKPSIPPPSLPHFPGQSASRDSKWKPAGGGAPCTVTTTRPNKSVNSSQNQVYTTSNNIKVTFDAKSTFVNSILAAERKVTASTGGNESKINEARSKPADGSDNKLSQNDSRKRSSGQQQDDKECVSNSNFSNEFNFRTRIDDSMAKRTRFHNDGHSQPNGRRNAEPLERDEPSDSSVKRPKKIVDNRNAANDPSNNEPIQWRKLCDIVDKLLDLSPNILKDLPLNDRRVKERNEILTVLSDDPGNFYAYVDKYGEQNVKWAVKMAQRILFPQGRYNKQTALSLAPAPLQKAIRVGIDPSELSVPRKRESTMMKSNVSIPAKQEPIIAKEWNRNAANEQFRNAPIQWRKLCYIVDKLLGIPTHVIERLPFTDNRVRERNDLLMLLSHDPEDFLLHDDKYGARNVDATILAAKGILCPDGVLDEKVRKIMLRQRDILLKGCSPADRSISRESESRKRSNYKNATIADEQRSNALPKEWIQLCDIVDKVLDTPKEVRIKMSKRDPRWEQRDTLLLLLSDDPDKLESQSDELGSANVDWAIKASKKVLFPHGPKDRNVFSKLSPQRKILLRNNRNPNSREARKTKDTVNEMTRPTLPEKPTDHGNGVQQTVADDKSPPKKLTQEKTSKDKAHQVNGENVKSTENASELQKSTPNDSGKKTSNSAAADDEEIDEKDVWLKLCAIVDKLLDLPPNAAEKLEPLDKRLIERNDILMVLSDDPENFSKFEANYGSTNVAWAVKSAKKLIYSNGKPNEKFSNALWKERDAIMCSEEEQNREDSKDTPSSECKEWMFVRKIATKVFLLSCQSAKNEKKLTKEQMHQQIELLLQLSDDPDIVRLKPICKKIGEGRVEAAIARCRHLLHRMRKLGQNALLNFENLRSKMVLYAESLNQSKNIKNYDVILTEVRKIVDQKLFNEMYGQSFNKWSSEQKLERNELAILLIKDPHRIESNVKYMEMIRKTGKATAAEIVQEVENCLLKCDHVKEAPAVLCPPIIAEIKDDKFMYAYKEKKLTHRIHRLIEQFLVEPKPEVFDVGPSSDGTLYVVCANAMTFDFLKKSINELDGLWNGANLTISKAPLSNKVLDIDDLKEIKMMLKIVPAEPFAVAMKQLKKANPKLKTNKWQLVPSSYSDPKKMFVMVDLESLVELERSKREVIVERGTIYFDIKYIGKENF